jgi:hypothetical protein
MIKPILIAILIFFTAACGPRRSEPEKSVVNLEVGVDYKIGGVQPVARPEFYLLDSDITAGNELDEFTIKDKTASPNLKLWALTAFVQGGYKEQRAKLSKIIQAHTAAQGTTDLQGKITFAPILPGVYYVLGWSPTRKDYELMIWNYRVEVKSGAQKVSLSSSDSALLAPYSAPMEPWRGQ